jgi:phenylpropionate dioxygenase-like ring-hydroxylating dioxygenase large terminal subunit
MAIIEESRPGTARAVPFAMHDSLHVPRERYYDREFFELEKQYLWPHVWQMAARLEEIPSPGDFVEYEICDQSVIVIRQQDQSIKAFHNTCRHRATQLCKGAGRLAGGQIVCPFHGWRWNLDGSNSFVYGAEGFDAECLRPEDIALQECLVDTWGGCVWINMDRSAGPLRDYLGETAQRLDSVGVGDMRVWWWKETIVNANWKMAQEAFEEGWHVMATHPQLTMGQGEGYNATVSEYLTFPNGHGLFQSMRDARKGTVAQGRPPDEYIARARAIVQGQDAMILDRDLFVMEGIRNKIPPGGDFGTAAISALYEYAEGAGIPLPPLGENVRLWGGDVFMFPNFFMLPQYANSLAYRFRPYNNDPEWARFEVWSLTMYPEGLEPQGRARLEGRYAGDDAEHWGQIPRQDISNMERQQKGLHSLSFRETRLATQWESIISNMHQELDRVLSR